MRLHLRSFFAVLVLVAAVSPAFAATHLTVPFSFERNDGQTDPSVQFLARGAGYTVFLTRGDAVLMLEDRTAVRMTLAGASRTARLTALDPQPGRSNYLIGSDPNGWRRNVPHYAKVRYEAVYPGIDALFYGSERRLEYDLVVAPGANPALIAMTFGGVDALRLDDRGDLVLKAGRRELRQHKPVAYQQLGSERRSVAAAYAIGRDRRVRIRLGAYDRTQPLIIDPVITYSTYLGGNYYDWPQGIAVDGAGNTYVTGIATSADFPVTEGALQTEGMQYRDGFVAKFDGNGKLVYSTFLGGDGHDEPFGIAVDTDGHAYVTGDFSTLGPYGRSAPVTAGAYQTPASGSDAYVFKLTPAADGVVYGARIGGNLDDRAYSIAIDAQRNAVVTGTIHGSANFPTFNAHQSAYGGGYTDGFLFKLNADGSNLMYSTFVGGGTVVDNNNRRIDEAHSVTVDATGHAYVTGFTNSDDFFVTPGALDAYGSTDVFVRKYTPEGALVYSARWGGPGSADIGRGIDVDTAGNAYVTGDTTYDYPTTAGAFQPNGTFDAFVTKLNPQGTAFVYSTSLGGVALEGSGSDNGTEVGNAIVVNAAGEAVVTGYTRSRNFPVKDAIQSKHSGDLQRDLSWQDAFVTKVNAAGSELVFSTYLGANGTDAGSAIDLDAFGNVYVAGSTSSTLFPTTEGAAQRKNGSDNGSGSAHDDVFVVKISNGGGFHAITPCRVIDTRYSGSALADGATRNVQISGRCGIPAGATSVSANLTAVTPATAGFLAVYPAGAAWPGTSTAMYRAGRTRATNAAFGLSGSGAVTVRNGGSSVHFIIDVTGYWK